MKRKLLSMLTALFCIMLCVVLFASCGKNGNDDNIDTKSAYVAGKTFVFEGITKEGANADAAYVAEAKAHNEGSIWVFNTDGTCEYQMPVQKTVQKILYTQDGTTVTCTLIEMTIDGNVMKIEQPASVQLTYKNGKLSSSTTLEGITYTMFFIEQVED